MSVVSVAHSLFSLGPRVREVRGGLSVRTNLLVRALGLFGFGREVFVHASGDRVDVRTTRAWLFHSFRRIRREDVAYVDYGYGAMPTSFIFGSAGRGRVGLRAADRLERFSLSLVLRDGEAIPLGRFSGSGRAMTGIGGVLLGDALIDLEGTQQSESLALARRVTELLGVPLGPPLPAGLGARAPGATVCAACDRPVPKRLARCQYCGGAPRAA